MATFLPHEVSLSDAHRKQVESWLAQFAAAWDENRLAARLRELPPVGDPLRLPTLLGLVRIDLRQRWQHGRKIAVEAYLKNLPELGTPETVATSLVEAEYEVRLAGGEGGQDLTRRFPRQMAEVRQRLEQTVEEGPPSSRPSAIEETCAFGSSAPGSVAGSATGGPGAIPEQLGRYRILEQLGQGGMGAVYLAHDSQLDRRVALKIPHFDAHDSADARERFYREARAAATIAHPNICPVFDVGEIDGIPYLTMSYIEGKPLAVQAGGKKLSQRQIAMLVRKVALALTEAHKRGIVHRDLKPSNILIDQRGEPIVMDFGLARRLNEQTTRLTQQGALLGTPAYMAPEQVEGNVEAMGPACDIYSLGVILYELLAGRLPFEGNITTILAHVLTREPAPLSTYRPDIDPALAAVCTRALAKKIADRFPTMAAFAAALTEYLRAGSAAPASPSPGDTAARSAHPTLTQAPAAATVAKPASETPAAAEEDKKDSRKLRTTRSTHAEAGSKTTGVRKRTAETHLEEVEDEEEREKPAPARRSGPRPHRKARAAPGGKGKLWALVGGGGAIVVGGVVTLILCLREGKPSSPPPAENRPPVETASPVTRPVEKKPVESPVSEEALSRYKEGVEAYGRKDLDGALRLLTDAIRLAPRHAPSYYQRALVQLARGESDQALVDYSEALKLNPKDAAAYHNRGLLYAKKKDATRALADYNEALRLDPRFALAYQDRGRLYYSQKYYEQALSDLNTALRVDPKLASAQAYRGVVYQALKQPEKALADYGAALQMEPRLFLAWYKRAILHEERKDHDKAVADFSEALKIDPSHLDAHNQRGIIYWNQDELDKALSDYTAILQLNPRADYAYNNRGLIYTARKDYDRALADFTKAIELDAKAFRSYSNRGEAYLGKEDYAAAIADCNQALRLSPLFAPAYRFRGRAHSAQRSFAAAILDLNTAIKLAPDLAIQYYYRGLAWQGQGSRTQAIADFTEAIRRGKATGPVYFARAEAYRENGQHEAAIADYTQALKLDAKMDKAYLFRAICHAARNDLDQAMKDLNETLRANSSSGPCYGARGILHLSKHDYDLAIADFDKSIELKHISAWNFYGRGFAYARKKQFKQALRDYNEAVKLDPNFAQVYYARSELYRSQGYRLQSANDRRKALELDPKVAEKVLK